MDDPEPIMGITEIAKRLGVSRQYAHRLTRRLDFPAPLGRITAGAVYRTEDVERWIAQHDADRAE